VSRLTDAVPDYCNSEHFLLLGPGFKERAEALLTHWCGQVGDDLSPESIRRSLRQVARLDAPAEVRKAFPELLCAYLDYLSSSGILPEAADWVEAVSASSRQHADSFRPDGSVRGETYRKPFADVGRNDPCPCGSGKKYKKCCMPLLK
jgi:hypothetical protein